MAPQTAAESEIQAALSDLRARDHGCYSPAVTVNRHWPFERVGAGLLFLALLSSSLPGCKSETKEAPTTSDKSAPEAVDKGTAAPPASSGEPAVDDKKAITEEFITRFTDAIDSDDVTRWPMVLTKARREQYEQEGVMDKAYAAWRRGTATVSDRIRKAEYRLEETPEKMTLHFEGVIVANDPENGYQMAVTIEDGKMYLDEK